MNISNISKAQLQEVHDFLAEVHNLPAEDVKEWLENHQHKLTHLLYAAETMWERCCDPFSSILELNEELKTLETSNHE